MKLCILALDGLEYTLVKQLQLKNLLQATYGTYPVQAEKYATPALWASFLTGISPQKFDIKFVKRNVPTKLANKSFLKPLKPLAKLIFKPSPSFVKGRYKTIFDHTEKPLPFNVFSYNETKEQFKVRWKYSLPKTVGNVRKSLKADLDWRKLTITITESFLSALKAKKWDLAMLHVYYTDIVGHLFYKTKEPLKNAYRLMDKFCKRLTSTVGDSILLIVSDHGMGRGIHTNHGFWSLNIETDWRPRDITDFYPKILEWTRK